MGSSPSSLLLSKRLPSSAKGSPVLLWSDLSLTALGLLTYVRQAVRQQGYSIVVANHFPHIENLCRKKPMAVMMERMRKQCGNDVFDFTPQSFTNYEEFRRATSSSGSSATGTCTAPSPLSASILRSDQQQQPQRPTWIIKPSSGCMGRGIIVTDRPTQDMFSTTVSATTAPVSSGGQLQQQQGHSQQGDVVCQRYIANPLLIEGRKFDLRCYVFVASVDPLRFHFCKDGLVRLCANFYQTPSAENFSDSSVHLSNYAVNTKVVSSPGRGTSTDKSSGDSAFDSCSSSSSARSSAPAAGFSDPTLLVDPTFLSCASTNCDAASGCNIKQSFGFLQSVLMAVLEEAAAVRHGVIERYDHRAVTEAAKQKEEAFRAAARGSTAGPLSCCFYHDAINDMINRKRRAFFALDEDTRLHFKSIAADAVALLWERIHQVVAKSLIAVLPSVLEGCNQAGVSHSPSGGVRCVELLGYDILLDSALKPWLVEVNHSPSWRLSSTVDAVVKEAVLRNVLHALALEKHANPKQQSTKRPAALGVAPRSTTHDTQTLDRVSGERVLRLPQLDYHRWLQHIESKELVNFTQVIPRPRRCDIVPLFTSSAGKRRRASKDVDVSDAEKAARKRDQLEAEDLQTIAEEEAELDKGWESIQAVLEVQLRKAQITLNHDGTLSQRSHVFVGECASSLFESLHQGGGA